MTLLLAAVVAAEETKYDDGQPDGSRKIGDIGFGIWFDGPIAAKSLKIHAARAGCKSFDVAAVDRDGTVLAQAAFEGTALPEKAGWAELAFPLEAEEGALFVVTFCEGEEGAMSWDKTGESHSTFFYGGQHHPFKDCNWMIRLSDEPHAAARAISFKAPPIPPGPVVRTDGGDEVGLRKSDVGHAIRIEAPADTVLSGVEVFAARTGRLARPFEVTVCDANLRPLHSMTLPCGLVSGDSKWVSLPFPGTLQVPKTFWLILNFRTTPADWIALGVCRNDKAVCSEALPGSVFRKFPPGEAWMVRAHFAPGKTAEEPAAAPGTAEDGQIVGEVAKKFFKALERLDRSRLLAVLAPDAPGFDWIRSDDYGDFLEGRVHRRFTKELARDLGTDRATLVYAAIRGPLLWDPPDEFRKAMPANAQLAAGPAMFTTDGPGRHTGAEIVALRLSKTTDGWKLVGWDEFDLRDAAWGKGLLPGIEAGESTVAALLKSRSDSVAAIDEEIHALPSEERSAKLLSELARSRAEDGQVARWAAIAKELPDDDRAMLEQTLFVEGRRCLACGDDEKMLKVAAELADTLVEAMEKRFGLNPGGAGKLRLYRLPHDESGFVFHPQSWAYPEIVWFVKEGDEAKPPDPDQMALAIADACVSWFDDAGQWRRWLAAGALATASIQTKETPAALENEVRNIAPSRGVVGGNLRIAVEVSRKYGDAALGHAIVTARRDGACRDGNRGRGLCLDEAMKALANETGKEAEVRELFGR
ncbi:MAG: hypothetical protein K8T20_04060 [Planctomycetes bacterium]|nr:hypothetical protein [Planctomycetota bacterium]